jgi:2-methylcitrate dehydratase
MFDGDITSETFEPSMFRDPKVRAFMQKIAVSEDPALTARQGASAPTRVTAILTDGQRITREVDYAPGFAKSPMSRGDVEQKFRGNVGKRWAEKQTDAALAALWQLDRMDDLAAFLGTLVVQAG